MIKKYLLTPGPTAVPESVLLEMAQPMIHHRTAEFEAIFKDARSGLQRIFNTKEEVLILLGSGTLAMEAAVINTLNSGDTALVINGGKFAERWVKICETFGVKVIEYKFDWGRSADPNEVKKYLHKNPEIKAVFMQGSETSTTAYHPVKEIAELTKNAPNTILVVDGITSVGVHECKMDDWGIDILVTGSQKAFMLPPGLAFISLSKKAWSMVDGCTQQRFYVNLKTELKNQLKNTTAWTAGVSLIIGLNKVIKLLEAEGVENVFKRHKLNADATRAAVKSLGMKLVATDTPSDAATGCFLPSEIDGKLFVKYLRVKCGVALAGGQDNFEGKIIRISHLGYHDIFDTITAIAAIEMGLKKFGAKVELGSGIKAAEEIIALSFPEI